jgi:putative ABC transport system permease protein
VSVRGALVRALAVFGIAFAQLRRSPGRTALAVLAVALAVLSATLLASLGVGVVETGEEGLDQANRDIWISNGPLDPSSSGSENTVVGAHDVAADLNARDDVRVASPMAIHEIYVGTDSSNLRRVPAVGVQHTHDGFEFAAGGGFELTREDYNTTSEGELARNEIVLDPRTAEELGVGVGDTVYLGASETTATTHEFTVVGTSDYYSQYLGASAATVPIIDLQAVTGTAGTDRAKFVMADVADDADREAVRDDLAAEYPEYDVRTSDQQVGAMFKKRPLVLASGLTLVGFAVGGGGVLTVNLFALVAYQQRDELAALRAIGLSRRLLAGTIGVQGLVIGILGGAVGVAATPPLVIGVNRLASLAAGFDRLLRTPPEIYAVGFALAIGVGTVVAVVTGWRAGRYARIEQLQT